VHGDVEGPTFGDGEATLDGVVRGIATVGPARARAAAPSSMGLHPREAPPLIPVRQTVVSNPIPTDLVARRVVEELHGCGLDGRVRRGASIGIAVGSRGISDLLTVVRATADHLWTIGCAPFVFPAMGSHGGATAEGQRAVLAALAITEAAVGCPIRSTMETVQLGTTGSGLPVLLNRFATEADGIVVVNRVKPHTHFRGRVESGICKMLAIGCGSHAQAQRAHAQGSASLGRVIPQLAVDVAARAPMVAAVGLLEDGRHQLTRIVGLPPDGLVDREAALLEESRSYLARLPLEELDILIVEEIGKDVSGPGMDTNVIGRVGALDLDRFETPRIGCIVILGLTAATEGNATGIGNGDVVTQRLVDAVDWGKTYANVLTGLSPREAACPIVAATDEEAIGIACGWLAGPPRPDGPRVARIRNTLQLELLWLSASALAASARGNLVELGPASPLRFDDTGRLLG
jgi:Lactate racemase N-terminal domain